jgi:HSP20 family molecular chaperone IbpA
MCTIRTLCLYLAMASFSSAFAESKKEVGFSSFKELGQVLDEQMNILNDYVDQAMQTSAGAFKSLVGSVHSAFEVNEVGDQVHITVHVPHVEDSDQIKAQVNTKRKALKVIVPQKDSITKVIIQNHGDTSSGVKYSVQQRSEQRHEGKNGHAVQMSASKRESYKTLPFAVDLNERSVEYKEHDQLVITLNKIKPAPVKKAQPRVIPVKSK